MVLLPRIKELAKENNVVLDGLYSWDVLKILQNEFDMTTIAIVADKKLRYQRLSERIERPFNKEDAIKRDISEIKLKRKAILFFYLNRFLH